MTRDFAAGWLMCMAWFYFKPKIIKAYENWQEERKARKYYRNILEDKNFIDKLDFFLTCENFDGNMIVEIGGKLYTWTVWHNLELIPFESINAHLSGSAFVYGEDKE